MVRGLYLSAAAMLSHSLRHELNSANLANLNTPGYKARRAALGEFGQMLLNRLEGGAVPIGAVGFGPAIATVDNDLNQGTLVETGWELDVALQGDGFFAVQTPEGVRFTRAGDFRRSPDGLLVTAEGHPVLGVNGVLRIADERVAISSSGEVVAGDRTIGRLRLAAFANPEFLERSVGGTFAPTDAAGAEQAASSAIVLQGFLENANVDAAAATVEMMAAFRAFEANQQAIRIQDETLRLAANELARF